MEIAGVKLDSALPKQRFPRWIKPMLATLTEDYFSDKNWFYERKLDGERCIVFKKNHKVTLYSRNKKRLNSSYPEIVNSIENQKGNFIVDGEIVAFEGNVSSFSKLQGRINLKDESKIKDVGIKVYYYIFDIMYYDKYDLKALPVKLRKKILKKALIFKDNICYTPHKNEKGEEYLKEACKKGWEGIIAKKADSHYVSARSKNWLKFKCKKAQEFVIGGYTKPKGSRVGFGAILIGHYKNGKLKYAGQVGTGFSNQMLKKTKKVFEKITSNKSPFEQKFNDKNVTWIKPILVCEVAFTEWTKDGKLRHPRFKGLRRDKDPNKVVKEG